MERQTARKDSVQELVSKRNERVQVLVNPCIGKLYRIGMRRNRKYREVGHQEVIGSQAVDTEEQ